jgi:hypothetical protein
MEVYRYRQKFLFLVVLILPTIAIAVTGRRIAAQEEELAKSRLEDLRNHTAAEIGQDLLARLERIKLLEIANTSASGIPQPGANSDPSVAVVGWTDQDRLVWPWDVDPADPRESRQSSQEREFVRKIEEAERVELVEKADGHAFDVPTGQRKHAFSLPAGSAAANDILNLGSYVSVSPDGRMLAIARWSGERQPHIGRWGIDGTGYGEYPVGPGLIQCVTWAKDGRSILFARSDDGAKWQILRLIADGSAPVFTGLEVTGLTYFDLNPSGSRIAFDGTASAIRAADPPSPPR